MDKRENTKFSISIKEIIELQKRGIEVQLFVNGKYYNYVDTSNEKETSKC